MLDADAAQILALAITAGSREDLAASQPSQLDGCVSFLVEICERRAPSTFRFL